MYMWRAVLCPVRRPHCYQTSCWHSAVLCGVRTGSGGPQERPRPLYLISLSSSVSTQDNWLLLRSCPTGYAAQQEKSVRPSLAIRLSWILWSGCCWMLVSKTGHSQSGLLRSWRPGWPGLLLSGRPLPMYTMPSSPLRGRSVDYVECSSPLEKSCWNALRWPYRPHVRSHYCPMSSTSTTTSMCWRRPSAKASPHSTGSQRTCAGSSSPPSSGAPIPCGSTY